MEPIPNTSEGNHPDSRPAVAMKRFLASQIFAHLQESQAWFRSQAAAAPPPFYSSVDLRDSGFKIVPVDSNLFPAGFNNICPADVHAATALFKKQLKGATRVLLVPELNTRNPFYVDNLMALIGILKSSGVETCLGWMEAGPDGGILLKGSDGTEIKAFAIERNDHGMLSAAGFVPELVVLNNDFSAGIPELLRGAAQPLVPSLALGWHSRKKSEHFRHYNALAGEFAKIIKIDPWFIQIDTQEVEPVSFADGQGVEAVALVVDQMLQKTRDSYVSHQMTEAPYVYIKNNAGTYGMGIMTAHHADDVRGMNRRAKNKMSVGKNLTAIRSVVVQEGIPTQTTVDHASAEPVIYLSGCDLLGGFLRSNPDRDREGNLNSQGMVFKKLCMSDLSELLEEDEPELSPILRGHLLELVYGSIARLSALAAGREILAASQRSI